MANATTPDNSTTSAFQKAIDKGFELLRQAVNLVTRDKKTIEDRDAMFTNIAEILQKETKYKPAKLVRDFAQHAPSHIVSHMLDGFRAYTRKHFTLENVGGRDGAFNLFLDVCANHNIGRYFAEKSQLFADIAGLGAQVPYLTIEKTRAIEERLKRVSTTEDWVASGFICSCAHESDDYLLWTNTDLNVQVKIWKKKHVDVSKPERKKYEPPVRPARIQSPMTIAYAAQLMREETGVGPVLNTEDPIAHVAKKLGISEDKAFGHMTHNQRLDAGWEVSSQNDLQVVYFRMEEGKKVMRTAYLPKPKLTEAERVHERAMREAKQKAHQAARSANAPKGTGGGVNKQQQKK